MKVEAGILRKLLEHIARKSGKTIDYAGLKEMSEIVGELGSEYLYKKIYQRIKNSSDDSLHGVRDFHINRLLSYLGFDSLDDFRVHLENPLSEQMMSLVGTYYCYVRANHVHTLVLRSPVEITREGADLRFVLKGKDQEYAGKIRERSGCLFILMTSPEGKCFHHVYKIGNRKNPKVLQGVFSGVSTAFDPIGGRTLLIRQDQSYKMLTNRKERGDDMIASGDLEQIRVASYFGEYLNNNLSPSKSSDFGYDDLAG